MWLSIRFAALAYVHWRLFKGNLWLETRHGSWVSSAQPSIRTRLRHRTEVEVSVCGLITSDD